MKPTHERKRIVVIGGGTGTYTLLHGLKQHWGDFHVTKIVSMADCGGSTGRLRDEFGQLPVGDARMGLAALAAGDGENDELLRDLFLYRFDKGNGLSGHNFGNLLLVALTDILGSEAKAIKAASRLLRIHGEVLPVTADNVHLVATYDDGVTVTGEHYIDEPDDERRGHRIVKLATDTPGHITADADAAIRSADCIVIGPGDLYASLLANCVITGVGAAIVESLAKFVYILNLMSRPGQTRGMAASDHVTELETYVGRIPDAVIINDASLPAAALARYEKKGDQPIVDDLENGFEIIRGDFLSRELVKQKNGDTLTRAFIRHDGDKLARAVIELIE